MNNRSIVFQLTIYILVTVSLMVAVGVYMNYRFSEKLLMEKIEENATHHSEQVTHGVVSYIFNVQEVVLNVAYQVPYFSPELDWELYLKKILAENPIVQGFRLELTDDNHLPFLAIYSKGNGLFEVVKDSNYCNSPMIDELKLFAKNNPEGTWSEPFYCPMDTSLLVINFTKIIQNNDNKIIGYLSGQVSLDFINKNIAQLDIENGGFCFIVDKYGTFLTHPNPNWVLTRNIFTISEQIFPKQRVEYESQMRSHQSGSGFAFPEMLNYQRSWFHFSPIPYTYWTAIVIIPAKQMFAELDSLFRQIILMSAGGLMLIILIILLIFRKMLTPLSFIARTMKRMSSEEFRNSGQQNEIQILSASLNDLQLRYTKHMNEVNQSQRDKRKIEKDLKSAKEIQMAIIPAEFKSDTPKIDLYATLHPAEVIGGDLYDYFFLDSTHLLVTIGDVSGKGIPAALFMAVAHTMVKSKSGNNMAHQIVEQVNNELSVQNSSQSFLTLFLGILNIETGEFSYCNAAHNYPYILTADGQVNSLDKTHGLPIGVYSSKSYVGDTIALKSGDSLVLYTDGVTDGRNTEGSFFGNDRLHSAVKEIQDLTAKQSVQLILQKLEQFRGEATQSDDISLMVIRYVGKSDSRMN